MKFSRKVFNLLIIISYFQSKNAFCVGSLVKKCLIFFRGRGGVLNNHIIF